MQLKTIFFLRIIIVPAVFVVATWMDGVVDVSKSYEDTSLPWNTLDTLDKNELFDAISLGLDTMVSYLYGADELSHGILIDKDVLEKQLMGYIPVDSGQMLFMAPCQLDHWKHGN